MFLVAPAIYGPETPTLVRSLNEAVTLYGPREGESVKIYDYLNAFFALGGSRAYVNRVAGEGSAAAALLELEAGATAKTLVVTAKYKGTYGNGLKVEVVENEAKTKTKLIIQNPAGEVLESSGEYAEAKELAAWGEEAAHQTYVLVTQGSGYSTGKTGLVKKIAATKLASGVNPTVGEKTFIKSIEGFAKGLGPGQLCAATTVLASSSPEEKVHTAMGEHASKNNRFALLDLKRAEEAGSTVAQLKTELGTPAVGIAGYMATFSSAVTAAGLTLGTTRTIPASPIVAGLCAQVSNTPQINQAPAGRRWSLAPFVTGLTNTYSEENMATLAEGGINPVAERQGIFCLFDFVTALLRTKDAIFCQASASRERMLLVASSEQIGERYLFATLDGRHQKRAKFQGELQGLIKQEWEAGSLYGEEAPEAGIVEVGEPINTLATEQNGELNAELIVRLSPFAEYVKIAIVFTPITENV
jgi:hypothetical protein